MKRWILCFFALSTAVFGSDYCLLERLDTAKPGDYVVTEANKMITVLAIRSLNSTSIVLEEISAPLSSLKKRPDSWPQWVKHKAPGHTSWSMVEIDIKTGRLLECFSFSRSAWIQLSQKESMIARLLHLPMQKVPTTKMKKIGPPPMLGEPDFRKVWTPPLYFEGKKIKTAMFDVYEAVWPQDNTELSGQDICVYFDRESKVALPFWIQVQTAHATAALRTIDSGRNLPVIYRNIPRRVPEFVGLPKKTPTGLLLNLKSPKYYKEFELYAIDITTKEKRIFPITHALLEGKDEWKTVEIALEDLEQTLETDHKYTWLLVPTGHSESYTETSKPFVWTSDFLPK